MTRLQIFKYILIESFILFFIAYLLGFMLGTLATQFVYSYINSNLNETISGIFVKASKYNLFTSFIISFILSFVSTVILQYLYYKNISSKEPAYLLKARNIDQVSMESLDIKRLRPRVSFNTYLSLKNILFRKKKYLVDTLAIAMSLIAITTTVFSSFEFGFNIFERLGRANYNYGIIGSEDTRYTADIINDLENIDAIVAENTYSILDGVDISLGNRDFSAKILILKDELFTKKFGPTDRVIFYNTGTTRSSINLSSENLSDRLAVYF